MRLSVTHELPSGIAPDAPRAVQHLLLTPPEGQTQLVLEWKIDAPGLDRAITLTDAYGNLAHLVSHETGTAEETIRVSGVIETRDLHGVVGWDMHGPAPALFRRATALTRSPVTVYGKFRSAAEAGENRIDILHALMLRLGDLFDYDPDAETAPGKETDRQAANAEEFAHAFVAAARALRIPARYVTGYYCGEGDDADAPAFHAWGEALDPGLGWVGFDPAHGICPTDRHVRLAVGLDKISTLPVRASPAAEDIADGKAEIRQLPKEQSQQQSQ